MLNERPREVLLLLRQSQFRPAKIAALEIVAFCFAVIRLTRVGGDHDWKEVARLAGLRAMEKPDDSSETLWADMGRTLAPIARMLAPAGQLDRKESPRVRHGKTVRIRPKTGEVRQQPDDDKAGLGSFGMRAPVLEHFRLNAGPDAQYRLALQRQQGAQTKQPEAWP